MYSRLVNATFVNTEHCTEKDAYFCCLTAVWIGDCCRHKNIIFSLKNFYLKENDGEVLTMEVLIEYKLVIIFHHVFLFPFLQENSVFQLNANNNINT